MGTRMDQARATDGVPRAALGRAAIDDCECSLLALIAMLILLAFLTRHIERSDATTRTGTAAVVDGGSSDAVRVSVVPVDGADLRRTIDPTVLDVDGAGGDVGRICVLLYPLLVTGGTPRVER